MTRRGLAAAIATLPFLAAACSLFTSLDGLRGGSDAGSSDGSADVGNFDGSKDAASDVGAGDSGISVLSCDAPDLVAYWPADERAGGVVHDCHQSLDGDFSEAGTFWGTRGDGGDLEFTGTGSVTLGMPSQLQIPGPVTVCGWFRSDVVPGSYISLFWNFDGSSLRGFELTFSPTSKLYAQVGLGNVSLLTYFPPPALGVWEHIAAVYVPGVELRTYLNGASANVTTMLNDGGPLPNVSILPDDHEVRFGDNYSSANWSGAVDDIRVFSRALTPAEILTLASQ